MAESRSKDYKNKGKDASDCRGRRQEHGIELRKEKRTEQLLKRRNVAEVDESIVAPTVLCDSQVANRPGPVSLADLDSIVVGVMSDNPLHQMESTTKCRMLLSKEKNPPIKQVLNQGLVPYFIHFLTRDENPSLQFEAAWTLTNIASGTSEQTRAVADAGAIPHLVKLLSSPSEEVREQAVWTLGNIAGDGSQLRDLTLTHGILQPLLYLLQPGVSNKGMMRNATWTVSNLCRGKNPQPPFETVRQAIPTLTHLLYSADEEVVADAAWALSYLTDGENNKIEAVVRSEGVISRLVAMLLHSNASIVTPALRAIGNMVTGSDSQTQAVLDHGALGSFPSLLAHSRDVIRKEACWTLSNVTAGSPAQIQAVIDANLINPLIACLQHGETKTRKEAVWVIFNLTSGGNAQQLQYTIGQGCIKPLVDALTMPDTKVIQVVLDALKNILKCGADAGLDTNPCIDWIDEAGGIERIEQLQNHENEDVYAKALALIETYFSEEDAGGDDQVAPVANGSLYGLNVPVPATGGFQF